MNEQAFARPSPPASPVDGGDLLVGFENKIDNPNGAAPSVVSFSCGGCGKNLKARCQLAGKKLKCTQCATPVQVPSIQGT